MRVFIFFLRIAIIAGIAGVFMYFFGGNVWLHLGSGGFFADARSLIGYSKDFTGFTQQCQQAPAGGDSSSPQAFQLRFIDNSRYALEVVCTLTPTMPITIKEGHLPPLMTKVPGSSGLLYPVSGDANGVVQLTSLGKIMTVQLQNDSVEINSAADLTVAVNPKAECQSFGYACCSDNSKVGQGSQLSAGVTDCPRTCWRSCMSVPFIELFTSDPAMSVDSHIVTLTSSSQDVVFNYGVNTNGLKVSTVHIDYGDGAEGSSTFAQGVFTHTYTCNGPCKYTVKLKANTADGKVSVDSLDGTIYIVHT